MSRQDALKAAEEAGLDLVEISPNADPPVVKIVDWGKFQYQKMKDLQRTKRAAKASDLKQMRFGLKIGSGDLDGDPDIATHHLAEALSYRQITAA